MALIQTYHQSSEIIITQQMMSYNYFIHVKYGRHGHDIPYPGYAHSNENFAASSTSVIQQYLLSLHSTLVGLSQLLFKPNTCILYTSDGSFQNAIILKHNLQFHVLLSRLHTYIHQPVDKHLKTLHFKYLICAINIRQTQIMLCQSFMAIHGLAMFVVVGRE